MKPALDINPTWLRTQSFVASPTWRWFQLERWLQSPMLANASLDGSLQLDPYAPSGYPEMLRTAAWLVIESIRRDGVSRGHLTADDMRWARRLGLALMGDGPVIDKDLSGAARSDGERERRAARAIARVVELFPESDQMVLRLALDAASVDPTASEAESMNHVDAAQAPGAGSSGGTKKMVLMVRLAKRHAAANAGVDLRDRSNHSIAVDDASDRRQSEPAAGGELHHAS